MLRLRTTLLFSIAFISIIVVFFSFSAQEVWAVTETLRPNATAGLPCWDLDYRDSSLVDAVDDITPDGDASYIFVLQEGEGRWCGILYQLTDHTGNGTINSVTVYARVRSYSGDGYAKTTMNLPNEDPSESSKFDVGSSYSNISKTYTLNPYTNAPWTWQEIDDLRAGVVFYREYSSIRSTQIYVVVDYSPPVITPPTVTTDVATVNVQNNQATLKGNVTNTGGQNADLRGFDWGTTSGSYPNSWTEGTSGSYVYATGTFSHTIPLTPGQIIYYRAKAHNSAGWGYGSERKVVIYLASGGQQQFTTCQCSTATIGGCCDGCNYCPAGKVFNGTSCVDATETVRCGYQNVCTAGSCSGYVKNRECKAGGVCDDTDTYYTTTDKYASAGKVLTSSCTDQDATSQSLACDSNTDYFCTAGNCTGYYRYSECKADHTCDNVATTNYHQVDVTASAGKVLTSSCTDQDATSTIKCASTVNKCTAGSCSGEKRYPECQAGGTCDSSATTYYTSESVYASAGKVLTSSCTDQDATSTIKCAATVNNCTAGSCSGQKKYPECQAGGVCDSSATTYYTSETVYASTGYTLTSTCGTTGTTLCGYSGWNGCNGTCQKKRDQLRCDASHNCAYDVEDDFAYLSTSGKVCSGGSEVAPSSSINCDKTIDCVDNSCSAARYYRGCTAGATSCTETGKVSYTAWNAPSNYTISETTYKVGDTCATNQDICGYSNWNKCGGVGSPYSCQKGRDPYRCNGAGSCTYDAGDDWANVAAGYVCSGGSEVAASATYYCGFSAYNGRSADKCDKKKDYLACNGSNVCNYGDYGDAYDYVSAYKIANSSGQEVDASSGDNTGTCHSCTEGSCSGTLKWSECDGSGNPGPCATYNQPETVYPSAGYTLTSTCGITGTTNCDTNICWDGGGHHEKCDRRCNTSHVCDYYNCVNHCTNGIKDCDETGIDCGGSCPSCDTTPPTTKIKVKRKSTGEDLTAAGSWLRADTYTIQFEDHDQAEGSGLNCENCSCEYSIYSCDAGGTNCNTVVVSLTSRAPNSSFDILAGKTAPTYNLEGVGRYLIYSGAKDMANFSAFEYRYINFDFTPPKTEIR